jgi:hypothetical protein
MMDLLWPLDPEQARKEGLLRELASPDERVHITAWADEDSSRFDSFVHPGSVKKNTTDKLRNAARLLHHEVRARLGDIRSKLALFYRFKTRCEWYDRERLTEEAEKAKGSAENRLTAELALFLFDQGLNPRVRARVSNLEPRGVPSRLPARRPKVPPTGRAAGARLCRLPPLD